MVLRSLMLKLVNEVDTEKHQLIYDCLTKTLNWKDNTDDLTLILDIFRDIIKLKYGRRVSHYGILTIIETLNTMLLHHSTKAYSTTLKVAIADTLALLYYFKFNQVLSAIQKSTNTEFTHSKHLFNNSIYLLCTGPESIEVIQAYFKLFAGPSQDVCGKVYTKEDDISSKLLGVKLKESKSQMEFTRDGHR